MAAWHNVVSGESIGIMKDTLPGSGNGVISMPSAGNGICSAGGGSSAARRSATLSENRGLLRQRIAMAAISSHGVAGVILGGSTGSAALKATSRWQPSSSGAGGLA